MRSAPPSTKGPEETRLFHERLPRITSSLAVHQTGSSFVGARFLEQCAGCSNVASGGAGDVL